MTAQLMSLPQDITWNRLAYSVDMFDRKLDPHAKLPRKWVSSMAAFYHVVPENETTELYPNRRLVYLKIVSSITGVNLIGSSAVMTTETFSEQRSSVERDLGKFQTSTLDLVITGLRPYWPCSGAILQAAVYPHSSEGEVSLWDYPYIQDFEPKKREIYQTTTRTGEVLSGSKSALNLKKGLSTADTLEESDILTGVSVKAGGWGISAETSVQGKWGSEKTSEREESEVRSTDTSRDRRETQSYTTNINQMYQPLISYHLGTNRALWIISPRPHTVDSENSLIEIYPRGPDSSSDDSFIGRKLEGIQDMFLVVNMPKTAKGLCFQATIDCGHELETYWQNRVIVLRRMVQSCAKFDGDTLKLDTSIGNVQSEGSGITVSGEAASPAPRVSIRQDQLADPETKRKLVFKANERSQALVATMLDSVSSGLEAPKPFIETETFRMVAEGSLMRSRLPLVELAREKLISAEELDECAERGLTTVGALMADESAPPNRVVAGIRDRLVTKAGALGTDLAEFDRRRRSAAK